MSTSGKILIAFLSLLCTVSVFLLLKSNKQLNAQELLLSRNVQEIDQIRQEQDWITSSLYTTITNLFEIHKSRFQVFLNNRIELDNPDEKTLFYFVNGHNDCGMCVENELFFLDSLAQINEAEFIVLRHSNSKKDFQFFKRNFDRNLTVIQLSNEEYESFFTNAYRFPFYYHEDLMGNPRFFVPNREFPKLSHDFVKAVFSGY
jgi:hypothetical protein